MSHAAIANGVRVRKILAACKIPEKYVFQLSNSSHDIRISIDATKALEYIHVIHNLRKSFSGASLSASGSMTRNSLLRLLQSLGPSALDLQKYF